MTLHGNDSPTRADDSQLPQPPAGSTPAASPTDGQAASPAHLSPQEILDQLADEYLTRLRAGENPSIAEYQARHPDMDTEIVEILNSVEMIENLKVHKDTVASSSRPRFDRLRLERIGDYRVVRELGRGGMGIVLEAIHESLGRKVAIKLLPAKVFHDDQSLVRFRREAQAAARLHHSNIVNVFGVGEQDGYHYYVMELVNGKTLGDWIHQFRRHQRAARHSAEQASHGTAAATKKSPAAQLFDFPSNASRYRWSAEKMAEIADALEYSHAQQILHRDIKPGNILLDQNQKPWLTDFGLVKELSNATMTGTGDIFGTPQYLAPESLEGKYDHRSEVYCLGLTLYELVALQPAYADASPTQIFKQIATSEPRRLRLIDSRIPRDLETIIHRAIDRDPGRRYPTAGELRDDLRRFCADLPIRARRTLPIERLYRWSRRNPLTAALTMLSAVLLILVTVISSYAYLSTQQAFSELAQKHEDLREAKESEAAARQLAEANSQRMRQEFVRAEANVDLSMQAFDRLFVQIMTKGVGRDLKANLELETFSEFSTLESSVTQEDARILQGAIKFYEQFTSQNQGNENLRLEIAKAYRRIANTYHFLGSFSSAQRGYQKAIEAYSTIVETNPQDLGSVVNLAETHNELALACRKQGKLLVGVKEHEAARRILEQEIYQDAAEVQFALANTLIQLCSYSPGPSSTGPSRWRPDNFQPPSRTARQALVEFLRFVPRRSAILNEAEAISRRLIAEEPDHPDYRLQRAKLFQAKATIFGVDGETEVEVQQLQEAINELESLIEDFPENPKYQYTLAHVYALRIRNVADDRQIQRFQQAVQICDDLVDNYPSVIEYLDLYASINLQLGNLLRSNERYPEAIESLRESQSAFRGLIGKSPSVLSYYFQYAAATDSLAESLVENGDRTAARQQWQELLWFLQRSLQLNRNRPQKLEILGDVRDKLRKLRGL